MITKDSDLLSIYSHACNGNESALSFVLSFSKYVHAIDDIIDDAKDGKPLDAEFVISTFVHCNLLFAHPFYLANIQRLQPVLLLISNAYADSVKWEGSDKHIERSFSEVLSYSGSEMLFAVALICGGYDHLRSFSPIIRERSWKDHHNAKGERI